MKNFLDAFYFFFFLLVVSFTQVGYCQEGNSDRLIQIERRLESLSVMSPGLNQKVQLSMSGASAQEFLRALAQSNNLNINIDPTLDFRVHNNFINESAKNIILFLAKEYDLDITLVGSIMSITKIPIVQQPYVQKDIKITYDTSNDHLGLDLNNDSLNLVARRVSQLTQKNLIVPVNLLSKKVSGFIASAPFESALEKLAYANEIKLRRTNDNAFIFQQLDEGEELFINAENSTSSRKKARNLASTGSQMANFDIIGQGKAGGNKVISIDAINTPIVTLPDFEPVC